MSPEGINRAFLDEVVAGTRVDSYYHLGLTSDDGLLERMRGLRAIVMAGSPGRIASFASRWSSHTGDTDVIAFPKEDRFLARYVGGVLFCSHGMGMPSASIAVQELMRLAYALTGGDLDALARIFWARVGTSGGIGLPGGSVVLTTEGVLPDLRPYRVMLADRGEHFFDGTFPAGVRRDIIAANAGSGITIAEGRTVATQEFFIEQYRLDGAICLETPEGKERFLHWLRDNGVVNIEMEGAMIAGYLNSWGFPSFAMICSVLLDRLEGDQIRATPEDMRRFNDVSGDVLFAYLGRLLPGEG